MPPSARFHTVKEENENDVRNGPVYVYCRNGKRLFLVHYPQNGSSTQTREANERADGRRSARLATLVEQSD